MMGSKPDLPVSRLLERLENVQEHNHGWRAACPAHDTKSKLSLSISTGEDGRVLLFDHGGCDAIEILHAVGLELSDLFEKPITTNMTPHQRRDLREKARLGQWKTVLADLPLEFTIVLMAAEQAFQGVPLNETDMKRLVTAGKRFRVAKAILCGR